MPIINKIVANTHTWCVCEPTPDIMTTCEVNTLCFTAKKWETTIELSQKAIFSLSFTMLQSVDIQGALEKPLQLLNLAFLMIYFFGRFKRGLRVQRPFQLNYPSHHEHSCKIMRNRCWRVKIAHFWHWQSLIMVSSCNCFDC